MEIEVESEILLSTLNELLPKYGLALPIQPSTSSITVAGTISTASHGSGYQYGTMSSYVRSIRLMQLNGEEKEYTEEQDQELFRCLTCSLGSFGVITRVRLQLAPRFDLELNRYYLTFNSFLERFKTHYSSSDYFYYLWYPHTNGGLANHLTRVLPCNVHLKNSIFSRFVSWVRGSLIELYRRPYHEIARCDRLLNFDTPIIQYAMEWAIPLDEAVTCLAELHQWIEEHSTRTRVHYPIEIRFSCSENCSYLSPCFERATCWISIGSLRPYGIYHSQRRLIFQEFQKICQRHEGRPHWAKEHSLTVHNFRQLYPQWNLFHEKRKQFDPNDLFINDYLQKIFGST
ncbi:unnamed protein product [Rotaria sordida]|uniref:FAD-binding PCMH-type domain-containing protein n=1 Tax=Rotaria sordida TaxID=392033 RepID=A0A814A3Y7_9BILA|nr:unnamed protein product [Rotaria sordida]CAF0897877.1 unnamed protein product [Rotaria sordida]CAF0907287.1 unnamed protein product [Rotaria sordida]CAF3802271.1 unnamed protein product [Rotaria sordida]CAF3888114.1 unnamed protein product [Rotaria sordida]